MSQKLCTGQGLSRAALTLGTWLVAMFAMIGTPGTASALVGGDAPTLFQQFRLYGDARVAGNTLMLDTCPSVNTVLLTESTGDISGVPGDAVLEGAFLFWSASDNTIDASATLVAANGVSQSFMANGACHSVSHLGGSYGCKADVTSFVSANKAPGGTFNGTYTVRGVTGDVGLVDGNCQCLDPFCQAKFAGWSLILVYSSPTETTERDIFVYDGFRVIDEELTTAGQDTFTISGFDVGSPPEASLSFFALEGDRQLGIPPQDLAVGGAACPDGSCIDSLIFNGSSLSSSTNPAGNVYNGTVPEGFAIGVDLDTYNVSSLVNTGDTSATIRLVSGDGVANNSAADTHGWGEYVIVNWLLLKLNRLAPNFNTSGTFLDAVPGQVAPGGTVFYTFQIRNDGSLDATNVIARNPLPPGLEYVPGTTRVDGVLVPDVGGTSALVGGLNLGTIPHNGDNDRRITVEIRVSASAIPGTTIIDNASISANQVDPPVITNDVEIEIIGPTITRPTKIDKDLNGGEARPGDIIEYEVFVSKQGNTSVGGLTFTDTISPFVQLIELPSGPFDASASSLNGGANGTGFIDVRDINIPANQAGVFVRYKVQILSTSQLIAKGVDPGDVNGLDVTNQGFVDAPFLMSALATDDPGRPGDQNPTLFEIRTGVDFGGASTSKSAVDVNGGALVPGDVVEFALTLTNNGTETGTVSLVDDIRPFLQNVTVTTPRPEVAFAAPPAGSFGNGRITISNLSVGAGASVVVRFTATVDPATPDGTQITNVAQLSVQQDPGQNRDLTSPPLTVFNRPLFTNATKTIVNQSTGGGTDFQPNDVVRYTLTMVNDGTQTATGAVVTDVVDPNLTAVTAEDGGTFNAGTRTLTWNLGDVAPGAAVTVHFTATIGAGVPNGTSIANQGSVDATNIATAFLTDDPATAANDDPTVITVEALPDLSGFDKTFSDENGGAIEPGDSILYTLTFTNDGRAVATNTVVTDAIDPAFDLASVQVLDGGTRAGNTVTWSAGTVAIGQTVTVRFRATLLDVLAANTQVANQGVIDTAEAVTSLSDDPGTPAADDPTVFTVVSSADLSGSTKTVVDINGGAVQPGDVLEYTLTLTNTGNAPATNVVVSDPIDTSLTNITPLDGGVFDPGTSTLTWTLAQTLLPGSPVTVRFSATVDPGVASGTDILNQGQITGTGITGTTLTDDPNTAAASDPTIVTVVRQPDFVESTKTVVELDGNGEFRPGDRVRYTVTVVNSGTTAATNVVVTDAVPANLTNVTAANGGSVAGSTVTWTLPTLAAGASQDLTFEADIAALLPDGTQIDNQAFVASDEIAVAVPTDDPATADVDDPTSFLVTSRPDLDGATKTFTDLNGGNVEPGDTIEYTISFTNEGTDTATGVVVTDVLDANLTNVLPGAGATFDAGTRTVTWPVGDVAPDASRSLTIRADVVSPLANLTRIDNQATIQGGGLEQPVLTDDPTTAQDDDPTGFFVVSAADLTTSTKTASSAGPQGYRPGDTVTWTISVINTGTDAASNVTVADIVPMELTNLQPLDGGNVVGNAIVWTLPQVAVGATVDVRFTAVITSPLPDQTPIANQATLSSPDFGSNILTDDPATPAVDDPTTIIVTSAPRFTASTKAAIDLDGDGFFDVGDRVRYELTVTNDGDAPATDVVVTDPVDASRLTNLVVQNGGTVSGSTITWNVAALDAGESTVLAFEADIVTGLPDGTQIANQASITDASGQTAVTDDPATPVDDDATVIVVVAAPRLSGMTKTVQDLNGGNLEPGDSIRYTITLTNEGTETATGINLTDEIDPALTSVSSPDVPNVITPAGITWPIPDLAPGQTVTRTIDAVVVANTPSNTVISNQAVVVADGPITEPSDDPSTPADDDPTLIAVNGEPDLTASTKVVTKLSPGAFLRPGDQVEYTITVRNDGFGDATNVVVLDDVPLELTNLVPLQGAQVLGQTIRWDANTVPELAAIPRGGAVNLGFRAEVAAGVPSGTVLSNQATVSADLGVSELTDDPGTPADDDPTRITVTYPSLSEFQKTVIDNNGGLVQPGDLLTYTITIVNGPSETLPSLTVTDTLAAALELDQVFQGGAFDAASNTITWNAGTTPALSSLLPGALFEVGFTARVREGVPNGTAIANQATGSGLDIETTLTDDPSTPTPADPTVVVVNAVSGADFATTTKTARDLNGGLLLPGDEIEYTFTVPNTGASDSQGTVLLDPVPMGTVYVASSTLLNGVPQPDIGPGLGPLPSGLLIESPGGVTPGRVVVGGAAVVTYRVRVLEGTPTGTVITNQGQVFDQAGGQWFSDDPATAQVDDPTRVFVGDSPALAVTKRDLHGGRVEVGAFITYEIQVSNFGSQPALGVFFRDEIPERSTFSNRPQDSILLDGVVLTPEDDGDAGRFTGNAVEVVIPRLEPGQTATLNFTVQAQRGFEGVIENTASAVDERGFEVTGSTITIVGDGGGNGTVLADKLAPVPLDGGTGISLGDELRYEIRLQNVSDVDATNVTLVDPLPSELIDPRIEMPRDGWEVQIAGNTLTIGNISVPANTTVTVLVRATLAGPAQGGTAQNGRPFCNTATVRVAGGEPQESQPACATPSDVPSGMSRLDGVVVHDLGENGTLDGADRPLPGYRVEVYRLNAPDGEPVAVTESAEDGTWQLTVPAGRYFVRQYTERGVQMGRTPSAPGSFVEAAEQGTQQVPVLIDPQGVIYDSQTGDPLSGVQIFVFYDDLDPIAPGQLVGPDDCSECANQQGQLTSSDGFYRFDLPGGRAYRLEVDLTRSQTFQFPSILVPAQGDVLEVRGADPIFVVPNAFPDLAAEQRYFLRFAIFSVDPVTGEPTNPDGARNNHIPLDPIRSLISLDKRVDKPAAQVGDVLTYKVTVQNRSDRDITFDVTNDPTDVFNGVFIQDEFPTGGTLRYVPGTARGRLIDGAGDEEPFEIAIDPDATTTGRAILRFGRTFGGEVVGIDLPAGGRIEVLYRAVVGIKAEPYKSYKNTAALFGTGNVRLSDSDSADVRISPDPIFDQGVILGKVFCDADGDGFQDVGEQGVYHARVMLDSGYYVDTDIYGKYHFHDVDPGSHQMKIDVATLPPGSTMTTAESRIFYMTRGLPVKINYGVACAESELVEAQDLQVGDDSISAADDMFSADYVQVSGALNDWRIRVEDQDFDLMLPEVWASMNAPAAEPPAEGLSVTLSGDTLTETMVFNMRQVQGPAPSRWKLTVRRHDDDRVVRSFEGNGVPPDTLEWDGSGASGQTGVLAPSTVYRYHLDFVGDDDDFGRSAAGLFLVEGSSEGVVADELFIDEAVDPLFDRNDEPTAALKSFMRDEAVGLLTSVPDDAELVVEVHTDDELVPFEAFDLTVRQAASLQNWLATEGMGRGVRVIARGSDYPFLPNFDDEARAQNRRVVVKHVRQVASGDAAALPELAMAAGATINDYIVPFTDEDFDVLVPRPVDGLLVVDISRTSGARAIRAVRIAENDAGGDADAPLIPVSLHIDDVVVDTAGTRTRLALDGVAVALPQPVYTLGVGELEEPAIFGFTVPEDVQVRGWSFEVRSLATDEVVYRARDDGEALTRLGWSGATTSGSPLLSGIYEARLTVLGAGASRGISAPHYFAVVDPGEDAPALPVPTADERLRINGRLIGPGKLSPAGRVYEFDVSGFTGEAFLVDLQRDDGARVVEAIRIPAGFERPGTDAVPAAAPAVAPSGALPSPDGDVDGQRDDTTAPVPSPDGDVDDDAGDDTGEPDDQSRAIDPVSPDAVRRSRPIVRAVSPDAIDLPDHDGFRPLRGHRLGVSPSRASARFRLVLAQEMDVDSVADDASGPAVRAQIDPDADGARPPRDVDSVTEPTSDFESDTTGLGEFGARELESALAAEGLIDLESLRSKAAAGNLKVALPPEDMVLQRNDLPLSGVTHPDNTVTVNGQEVTVGSDGRFHTVVTLPDGRSSLVIEATDTEGNRGRIEWPVEVAPVQYFLMAFADTAVSSNNFALDGSNDHNSYDTGDVMLYGQARLYFKGRLKGSELGSDFFETYQATAHLDTGKKAEFEEMFSMVIQPDEYYPVYGDSADQVHDVNARGKLYLLVEADESYLKFANFEADVHGIQHFDYARSLYGLDVAFDKTFADTYETKVRTFVAGDSFLGDGAQRLRHTYNYLRGTGGSLYYLDNDFVVEGSEQVFLVVKDKVTGAVLERIPQTRNVDYTIRYAEGRLIFKSPVSSVADAAMMTGSRIHTRDTYEGHPVFIEVGYQYESDEAAGDTTWGVQGRETFHTGVAGDVSIGVGFVEEGRDGALAGSDYQLFGVDAAWRPTTSSFIEAEYARSRSFDAFAALSEDGGLTFGKLQRRDGVDDVGNAIYVKGAFELADVLETDRTRVLQVGGFFDQADEGFYANRNALERGTQKFGSHVNWNIDEQWAVGYRNDFLYSEVDDLVSPDPDALKTIAHHVHRIHADWTPEDHRVGLEYNISYTDDFFEADGHDMHTVAAAYEYRGIERLTLGIQQEAIVLADDDRLVDVDEVGADRFTTSLTASWQILDDLALEATERVRWNGENSTRIGLRSQLTDSTSTYIQQRFDTRESGKGLTTTTVVGGEQKFFADQSGRAFGEYQIEGGASGRANRAIAGIGKTWNLARGVTIDTAYERTQIFGRSGVGDSSRDVLSVGAELTRYDFLKAGTRFEFRYDQGEHGTSAGSPCQTNGIVDTPEFCRDLLPGGFDKYQVVSLNNLDVKLTEDLTLLARYNLAITHNITLDALEQIDQALSFGVALRPIDWDVVNILAKYTYLDSQRPLGLEDYTSDRTQKHVVSVVPVYELPWDFQIVNKIAFKRVVSQFNSLIGDTDLPTVISDTLLFIFRLNYHLWRMTEELTLDVAGEYRFKEQFDPESWEHGALFEVDVVVYDYLRLGVGYNFTSFTDNEFADDTEDAHGWFFRVQGQY